VERRQFWDVRVRGYKEDQPNSSALLVCSDSHPTPPKLLTGACSGIISYQHAHLERFFSSTNSQRHMVAPDDGLQPRLGTAGSFVRNMRPPIWRSTFGRLGHVFVTARETIKTRYVPELAHFRNGKMERLCLIEFFVETRSNVCLGIRSCAGSLWVFV